MTNERKTRLVRRWAFLTGGSFALFWTTWYFAVGSVPAPFTISRWWDVLLGPIYSTVFIILAVSAEDSPMDPLDFCMVGLMSGLCLGGLAGLAVGMGFGLVAGIAWALHWDLSSDYFLGCTR